MKDRFMKHKKSTLFIGLFLVALTAALVAYISTGLHSNPAGAGEIHEIASLDRASFKFAITDIEREGNVVSFTIPEDARALEKKADAVVLSGLYVAGESSADCPVVQSTAVDKSVDKYNPISGKARVTANFDDENLAKAALEKGCLLINDPI